METLANRPYTVTAWKKRYFLVTPDELETVAAGFHHVVTGTGVSRVYTESDPADFLNGYRSLYARLAGGDRLTWKQDYALVDLRTGLTGHMENVRYVPMNHLSVPAFAEPCVELMTFAVLQWKDSPLTKNWEVSTTPETVFGLKAAFPSKVLFNEEEIRTSEALRDVSVWQTLGTRIAGITKPLTVTDGKKTVRTDIRVSAAAKADLPTFYAVQALGLTIL